MASGMRKMMSWRPGQASKKLFQVRLSVHSLEALPPLACKRREVEDPRVVLDVKWKGPESALGSRFRKSLKRSRRLVERVPDTDGVVALEEEFEHVCGLPVAKDGMFQPWYIRFVVYQGLFHGSKAKLSEVGTAVLNIAEYAASSGNSRKMARIAVSCPARTDMDAALNVSVDFVELRSNDVNYESTHKVMASPSLSCIRKQKSGEIDVLFGDVKQSPRRSEDGSRMSSSSSSSSSGVGGGFFESDSDSDSSEDNNYNNNNNKTNPNSNTNTTTNLCIRKSLDYGTLVGVNLMVEGALPSNQEELSGGSVSIHSRSPSPTEAFTKLTEDVSATFDSDQSPLSHFAKRSLLPWKRRKLSFRSPRREKGGEPLLNKTYGEEGGDDIDHDRRQAAAAAAIEPLSALFWKNGDNAMLGGLDFGEDCFSVGSWEHKELVSRDGQSKLSADVFFASIDQRSERAGGESACTALVAVIADWLHRNPNNMPIRAELDTLIREGSAEWRKLCVADTYKHKFSDKHFDLDTVLEAGVRPLQVLPDRSFIGFFQPEALLETCGGEFLRGAMSFDDIWDEIVVGLYIVSWNDHFFLLKVESDACYIIDTLGERLFEGCRQAYILRFDANTSLCYCPSSSKPTLVSESALEEDQPAPYRGLEACREFVKGFLAALPLRELQIDVEKGLTKGAPLHQRLQIEFHFTSLGSDSGNN